jgi:hypothetical protein
MSNQTNYTNHDISDLISLLQSCKIPVDRAHCHFCNQLKICKIHNCKNVFRCNSNIKICNTCWTDMKIGDFCDKCNGK